MLTKYVLGAALDPKTDEETWLEYKDLVSSQDQHVGKAWEGAYRENDALEAHALETAAHLPSEYFNTSRFSTSTLKLIRWSFARGNPALLRTATPKSGAKTGHTKDLSYTGISNLLSSVLNLMATVPSSKHETMAKALLELLQTIDPESSFLQVLNWYSASLFDSVQSQVAPPSGWRHWSTTSQYLEDVSSVPHFEQPQLEISDVGKRNKLGDFNKHQNWKGFTDILVHPLALAAVLDHRKALTWVQGALEAEDRTDPFDAAIDIFDLLLDALYFSVLAGRKECCDILHKTMRQVEAPPLRGNKARLVRIARTLMWAQLRDYRDVIRRLIDCTLQVYGRGILDEAVKCTDDAGNSLLFYLIEFRNFDTLAKLLVTLEGAKLSSRAPTTAASNTLVDFTRAFMKEVDLKQDKKAMAALHAIEALEERTFSTASIDSGQARVQCNEELKRTLSSDSKPLEDDSSSDKENKRHTTEVLDRRLTKDEKQPLEKVDSVQSLDAPKPRTLTARQEPNEEANAPVRLTARTPSPLPESPIEQHTRPTVQLEGSANDP